MIKLFYYLLMMIAFMLARTAYAGQIMSLVGNRHHNNDEDVFGPEDFLTMSDAAEYSDDENDFKRIDYPSTVVQEATEFVEKYASGDPAAPLRLAMEQHQWDAEEPVDVFDDIRRLLAYHLMPHSYYIRQNFINALLYGFPRLAEKLFLNNGQIHLEVREDYVTPMLNRLTGKDFSEHPEVADRYRQTLDFICLHFPDRQRLYALIIERYFMISNEMLTRIQQFTPDGRLQLYLSAAQIQAMWQSKRRVMQLLYSRASILKMQQRGDRQSEAADRLASQQMRVWEWLHIQPWIEEADLLKIPGSIHGKDGDDD